jgi:(E)-benzylidenesuccinyl-CoA hydratase
MSAILCERHGPVTLITLNRPEKMNSLDYEANQQLIQCFREFQGDDEARVAVVTGAGEQAFCAGADLKTFTMAYATRPAPEFRQMFIEGLGFGGITRGLKIDKPIIAAINGYAMSGGFELALAADVRFCSPDALFAIQDVRWGMHPCDGGCVRLPKIVGLGRAMEIILSGERFDAAHAQRIGLVSRIIPQADLVPQTIRYAQMLATRSPMAQRFVKDVEYRAPGLSLEEAIRMELRSFSDLAHSEDLVEGVTAFKERRPARLKGR